MSRNRIWFISSIVLVAVMLLTSCGGTVVTPAQVTVIVGGTPITQVVTPTPEPEKPVDFNSADPTTYVAATIGEPETLDPALCYETAGGQVIQNVYDSLVFYNKEKASEFIPQLAESWELSADGTIYTFKIRQGIKFHAGGDMTPEDVAYSFQRGLLQGGPASPQWLLTEPFFGIGTFDIADLINPDLEGDAEGVKATDPATLTAVCERVQSLITFDNAAGTVTMKLVQPWGPFLGTIAQSWGAIMDKEWVIEKGGWDGTCATWQNYYAMDSETDPFTTIANGTGPFMLDHWTQGEEFVLTQNPNYWRTEPGWEGGPTGPAALQRIIVKSIDEWGTRFAMMQAGDVETGAVAGENYSQVDPMVGELCLYQEDGTFSCNPTENPNAPLRLWKGYPTASRTDAFFTFQINNEGGNPLIGSAQMDGNGIPVDFFSDIHVRKAFNYCFDWDAYIADALSGEAVQNVGITVPGMLGYDPNGSKYTFDMTKCEEEFKAAWGGQLWETGFRFQVAYNTGNVTRQTVAEIMQSNIAELNDGKFVVEIIGLPWPNFLRQQREKRLPIFISGWLEDIHDPHNWAVPFTVGTYGGRQVLPDDVKAVFQDFCDRGVGATDPAERDTIYKAMNEYDYEQAIAIRLAVSTGRRYEQRWVKGWYYNPIYPGTYFYGLSKD